MRLFLLPDSFKGSSEFELTGKEFNYLINVLRLKENTSLTGRDKDGNIWNLTIVSISKNSCNLTAVRDNFARETTDAMPQSRPTHNIILYQCLPKGKKADEIIKRATEIGVRDIVLVKSKNCISDISDKQIQRIERYESLVKEAVQQSGSLVPTKVSGVIDIQDVTSDFINRCREYNQKGLGIILHQCKLQEQQKDLVALLKDFNGTVGILVGPEGGFTDQECEQVLNKGFNAVLLKSNILRCETAAIYAMSAVQTLIESN